MTEPGFDPRQARARACALPLHAVLNLNMALRQVISILDSDLFWEGRVCTGPYGNLGALVVWWQRENALLLGTLVSLVRVGLLDSTCRTLVPLAFLLGHVPPRVP